MHRKIKRNSSVMSSAFLAAFLLLAAVFSVRYYFRFNFGGYFWPWVSLITIGAAAVIILTKFSVWTRDYIVITDKRIIYHHQKGIFAKTVTEVLYSDIVEVGYIQKGISSNLFSYGDLRIKTMSGVIHFKNVGKPKEIVELINNQRELNLNE